jgi:dynein heavy chain
VFELEEMLALGVVEKVDEIETASVKAIQESVLKEMFQEKILLVWKHLEFEVMNYKDRNDTFILGGIEPVMEALDDGLVTLNTILGSRFCAPIRHEVTRWQKKLVLLSDTLDEWLLCQKQWMYLETIFSAADIQRQLPGESKRFFDVDKSFRQIMGETYDVPKAVTAGTVQGRKLKLAKHNTTLCLSPEASIHTQARIGNGWPIYPVGLVVWNPVEPLNDRNVNLIFPVDSKCLSCQFLESWIIASQRSHLIK